MLTLTDIRSVRELPAGRAEVLFVPAAHMSSADMSVFLFFADDHHQPRAPACVRWRAQNREEYMHRRNVLSISAIIAFSLALLPGGAVGQQKSLKEQLVGVWTLVSFDSFDGSGAKIPNMEGGNLKGQ